MKPFYAVLLLVFSGVAGRLHAQTYTNPAPITIPSSGQATPFPSTINVTGATLSINGMSVTLNGLSHTWHSDIDVVLVSPGGEGFTIMSDVGGSTDPFGNYTMDDDAPLTMSITAAVPAGIYKPTDSFVDVYGAIPFPIVYSQPAGAATFASVYGGDDANGTWSLYVLDDVGGDSGQISGGWSITFDVPIPGCTESGACNYNPLAGIEDGSCDYSCFGCTYPQAVNYSPLATIDDGSCVFNVVADGCTDPDACNYCNLCETDDGSCDYSCLGCTYPAATNYDPAATIDDGSCQFPGCTDPTAYNYNPLAVVDDGSCDFAGNCFGDFNQDGIVGVADVLLFIQTFGGTCN
jgi:subtilisin-like proprotein convertase family protein